MYKKMSFKSFEKRGEKIKAGQILGKHQIIPIIFIVTVCFSSAIRVAEAAERKLYEKNSLYQFIAVIENSTSGERYIFNSKRDYLQGGILVHDPDKLLLEYYRISFISLAFMDRHPKSALFVGLGAGAMPRYFHRYYPDAAVDVAEIDPDILDVAKKFFSFNETPRMKVHLHDGRIFIKRAKGKYDIIFLDAYQNDYIPFHLTTAEFLREIKKKLHDGGVVVSNITSPFRNKFFDSMIATYKQEFPHLYIFRGRKSNNFIFIASLEKGKKEMQDIAKRAETIHAEKRFDIDLQEICLCYGYHTEYDVHNAKVLTDDFAPVNVYRQTRSGPE